MADVLPVVIAGPQQLLQEARKAQEEAERALEEAKEVEGRAREDLQHAICNLIHSCVETWQDEGLDPVELQANLSGLLDTLDTSSPAGWC